MPFLDLYNTYSFNDISKKIQEAGAVSVKAALHRAASYQMLTLDDVAALLSPAAGNYLEEMCALSQKLTQQRFGKTISLFAPLYLSNECQNICTYCGFSYENKIERLTLSDKEIVQEAKAVRGLGFEHVLLVSGEANKTVGVDYFERAINLVRPVFSQISLEVQPLKQEEYARLTKAGLHTVLVYQETYHRDNYKIHHPKGKKSNFEYRLETPDRLGKAGVHKIGLGVLLGLEDWRADSWFTALHLSYLRKKYWRTKFTISFPRLRPAEGVDISNRSVRERELLQLIAAYRLFDRDVELSLSTRESIHFRDHAFTLGVTSMSAGSKTDPGGYVVNRKEERLKVLEQFSISDERTPKEVSEMISRNGYEPVWKDWDTGLAYVA